MIVIYLRHGSTRIRRLIWVAILTLMCSRRIHNFIKNVNPENAYRYTQLRWAKIFGENAYRLLKEVIESTGMVLNMTTIYDICLQHGPNPNINRERLMEGWIT